MNRTLALAFLAAAWLLGLAAAAYTEGSIAATLATIGFLGAASFALWPRPLTLLLVTLGAAAILTATWRYEETVPTLPGDSIASLNDGDAVRYRAMVNDEPQDRPASRQYRLAVREAYVNGRWLEKSGQVLVYMPPYTTYEYGDLLLVKGKLETPPVLDDFDYRDYLFRRGIVSIAAYPDVSVLQRGQGEPWKTRLFDVRAHLSESLSRVLPEPEASLAGGILFGTRSGISPDLRDDMSATGTSHLVAVSGQNVTILAGLMIAALSWLVGRRPACWVALATICAYAVLVGAQPSVVRAAIMGALYIMSIALGRQNTAAVTLVLAAAAMTAINPQIVHDVSFQLSFASVLGLALVVPPLNRLIERLLLAWPALGSFPGARVTRDVLTMTLASIAFTLPITALNFQQVSVVAPLANLFAVPAFVAVASTSAVGAGVGLLFPGAATGLSFIAWPAAAYMIAVIRLFAGLPIASFELGGVHAAHAVVYYAGLAAFLSYAPRQRAELPERGAPARAGPRPRLFPIAVAVLALATLSGFVWLSVLSQGSGRLTVTFLDVGQGDAILIEGPAGNRILVDGGASGELVSEALGRHLPFYDRRIDLVVLTHPQADHMGGLPEVLERFHVGGLLTTRFPSSTDLYDDWRQAAESSALAQATAVRGEWIDLGDGARLTVLNPAPETMLADDRGLNDTSIVLRLSVGDIAILLTGDITSQAEHALVKHGTNLRSTVLKVPHHGSKTSSSPDFLQRVQPVIDVISAGKDNPFGHPAPEVIARLDGDAVFRTDEHGDITVSTDGKRLWVETQR